jgi:hypothetical protein
MTAEGLFEAYLNNNSKVTKDYSLFDIFIVDDFIECWHDDRLFGFVVYNYEKSKRGFIEIFTASEEYGICEEDGKIDILNVENIDLYYDFDTDEIVDKSRLIQSYCNQIQDGSIDTDTSFDGWLDRLLDENLKKIL